MDTVLTEKYYEHERCADRAFAYERAAAAARTPALREHYLLRYRAILRRMAQLEAEMAQLEEPLDD
ncbi:MAG: hypothetical protein LBD92_07390 [Oscillospiraceae bacterium]|jgi:hypothetical protein|nr:hypothetical protein [Oscillospiraceae bacterium]